MGKNIGGTLAISIEIAHAFGKVLYNKYATLDPHFYFRNEMLVIRRSMHLFQFRAMVWKALDDVRHTQGQEKRISHDINVTGNLIYICFFILNCSKNVFGVWGKNNIYFRNGMLVARRSMHLFQFRSMVWKILDDVRHVQGQEKRIPMTYMICFIHSNSCTRRESQTSRVTVCHNMTRQKVIRARVGITLSGQRRLGSNHLSASPRVFAPYVCASLLLIM